MFFIGGLAGDVLAWGHFWECQRRGRKSGSQGPSSRPHGIQIMQFRAFIQTLKAHHSLPLPKGCRVRHVTNSPELSSQCLTQSPVLGLGTERLPREHWVGSKVPPAGRICTLLVHRASSPSCPTWFSVQPPRGAIRLPKPPCLCRFNSIKQSLAASNVQTEPIQGKV